MTVAVIKVLSLGRAEDCHAAESTEHLSEFEVRSDMRARPASC